MRETSSRQTLEIAAPVLVALVALALWQGLVDVYEVPPWLVPSPARVLATLVSDRELLLRALPYFFGGLRIASGLALIGAVVAEFVAGTGGQGAGLAYQILMAGIQLNVPRLFAALVLITLAGVGLFGLTVWVSKLALSRWHESEIAPGD